ncbi:hypothetical protein Bsp3421_002299 [Burkholderia sp. FERM BP-3421]|nr:hypothetical protein [Burkholderia sp. FERM BP-3421]WDD92301.1 hypothetical protein Bsp3421_002299 [Burkholderia sp. FERM BP-3421]
MMPRTGSGLPRGGFLEPRERVVLRGQHLARLQRAIDEPQLPIQRLEQPGERVARRHAAVVQLRGQLPDCQEVFLDHMFRQQHGAVVLAAQFADDLATPLLEAVFLAIDPAVDVAFVARAGQGRLARREAQQARERRLRIHHRRRQLCDASSRPVTLRTVTSLRKFCQPAM